FDDEVDEITCRIRHPIIDTRPAQTRFTEYQQVFTSAIQGDERLRQDRSREDVYFIIGKFYCGCTRGMTLYFYRSQEPAEKVIERFANDIHVPGWRVRYSNADRVEYRNAENTVEATIRIRSRAGEAPTMYEVDFTFAEPSLPNCYEIGE
ncbi:MAG: hypothetical protein IT323_00355, partial [Anaerolineae bacterium]|nr:hypothetical protein [Anaerolineae bacterium]